MDIIKNLDLSKYKRVYIEKGTSTFRELISDYYLILEEGFLAVEYYNYYGDGSIFILFSPFEIIHGINYDLYKQNRDLSITAFSTSFQSLF